MLETATVTLNYKEFRELVEKAEETNRKEELIGKIIAEKEESKEVKALDNISDMLINASKQKTAKEK